MSEPAIWAVIPAAGRGVRMQTDRPKQYLELHGRPVISHALERLAAFPALRGIVVGLDSEDRHWAQLTHVPDKVLATFAGGSERAETVLNGLAALASHAALDDWVMVHDAVRPCVRTSDVAALATAVKAHPDGGLLALPLTDTLKRADDSGRVYTTLDRQGLWRALTPQMFRFEKLRDAMERSIRERRAVTDESAAIELCGGHPLLVLGHGDNIKITYAGDLALAKYYLKQQQDES